MKNEYDENGNAPMKVEQLLDKLFKTRRNNAEDQEERSLKLEKMRLIKKYFGWKNEDIAKLLKTTPQTVKSRLSPSSKQNLPIWVDAFIAMFETLKHGTLARIQAAEDRNKPAIIVDEYQHIQAGRDGFRLFQMAGQKKLYLQHYEAGMITNGGYDDAKVFPTYLSIGKFAEENGLSKDWFVE